VNATHGAWTWFRNPSSRDPAHPGPSGAAGDTFTLTNAFASRRIRD
jgi:hypothetical protein